MANQHVVIVDFNHMLYNYFYGMPNRLSIKVQNMGVVEEKDTTIQSGTLKNIFRWSGKGTNPTAVCFDRQATPRKVFFQSAFGEGMKVGTSKEYKGNRERMPEEMFTASKDVAGILADGGVSCYAVNGYEADDLIKACIDEAKVKYEGMHIDVITNDADLLPLVDDTVSVYLRSKKGTFAEDKTFEKNHYIEVTPRNYEQIVSDLSAYKGFNMKYNTLLLHKLLRGDMSDQFGCKDIARLYPATKWNAMITQMESDGVNLATSFKYGPPVIKIMNRVTGEEFKGTAKEALASPEKANLYQKVCNPVELDVILDLLRKYSTLSDEQIGRVEKLYWGMNLNMLYPHTNKKFARFPYRIKEVPLSCYNVANLKNAAKVLQINLY